MRSEAVQIGAESPELGAMSKAFGWFVLVSVSLASLSALWVLTRRARSVSASVLPTAVASDDFDVWVSGGGRPAGVGFASNTEPLTLEFAQSSDSMRIWWVSDEPTALPPGMNVQAAYGGWLLGLDLGAWKENPGEMASRWQPRKGGVNRLERIGAARWRSTYQSDTSAAAGLVTDWVAPVAGGLEYLTLPESWVAWGEAISKVPAVKRIDVGAFPLVDQPVQDSISWRAQAAWMECELADGTLLQALAGVDSATTPSDDLWQSGVWFRTLSGDRSRWDELPRLVDFEAMASAEISRQADFIHWDHSSHWEGTFADGGRLIWTAQSAIEPRSSNVEVQARVVHSSSAADVIGTARNHRTGEVMELYWTSGAVEARTGDAVVWTWPVESEVPPQVWEVDLYRNGKYQVAIGAGGRFVLVDVLGRAVKGFPKRWSTGFSAFAVVDYDRNRQYRFLLAAPNGELFNFRDEGERTPGWKFKPQAGRHIVALDHLRIGPRDYLMACQDDGSLRFLKRTGEDRFTSPVRLPFPQQPAFRLGATIDQSTILYVDESGWVQEQVLGTGEFTGISRMTRGIDVKVEDRTGDGIPEVIVRTAEGTEEVWNARNERISADLVAQD